MTHDSRGKMDWLVSDLTRARALIKYEIKQNEKRLDRYIDHMSGDEIHLNKMVPLSELLINHYCDYLLLLGITINKSEILIELSKPEPLDVYQAILTVRKKLGLGAEPGEEKKYITELIKLYSQFKSVVIALAKNTKQTIHAKLNVASLRTLLSSSSPEAWLKTFVEYCNRHIKESSEFHCLFSELEEEDIEQWRYFFSNQDFIEIFHAVFFYKLHPQRLFDNHLPLEKLVSIRSRLSTIYQSIEAVQQQLLHHMGPLGLPSMNDYLFHGDELPKGVVVEVSQKHREHIQIIVGLCKTNVMMDNESQVLYRTLHELSRVYKFWFNPNRLVDTVMALQQLLLNQPLNDEFNQTLFKFRMHGLFGQMKTTDCLDLYGYFSNKDSGYLLRILHGIIKNQTFSWLPVLKEVEKKVISRIFVLLSTVMAALREELASRHIVTENYPIDYSKPVKHAGRRNRQAVLRAIELYGKEPLQENRLIEELFNLLERSDFD